MKKIFLTISGICFLFFTGCATKPAAETETPIEPNLDNLIENSDELTNEISDALNSDALNIENSDTPAEITFGEEKGVFLDEETESLEKSDDEDVAEDESEETSEDDSDLPDFEEPEVITLEPEYIPEPEPEPEVEPAPEEPIEVETPPVIEVTEDNNSDDVITVEDEDSEVSDVSNEDDDVIDITNDSSEDTVAEEAVEEVEIIPSRKVTLKKQEYVDITYPGTGWVYMGLVDGTKDLSYFGRKLGTTDTKFTLQAKNAGTKIIHFYKNDSLTNNYIDDYIEVEILAEKGSNKTHIAAPEYKQPVPKKAKEILQEPVKKIENVIEVTEPVTATETTQTSVSTPLQYENIPAVEEKTSQKTVENKKETILPKVEPKAGNPETPAVKEEPAVSTPSPDTGVLLKEAAVLYNEKEYKAALDKLSLFFEYATKKRDEALFLKGQILEAKSNIQDVKGAMEAYNSLIKNYPTSKHWDDANKRIIYLRKFYFGG